MGTSVGDDICDLHDANDVNELSEWAESPTVYCIWGNCPLEDTRLIASSSTYNNNTYSI